MREISKIVLHCSASPDALDIGFQEINQWHLDQGWSGASGIGCGYHFIVRRNGTIEVGRIIDEQGAHVDGENRGSIGICLVGTHEFEKIQFESTRRLIQGLLAQFPECSLHEHREFQSAKRQGKTCPNFNLNEVL